MWIDSPGGVAEVCRRAAEAGVVAIDSEADSLHSYFHKVCLIQLSYAGQHALLDPLALGREGLTPLVALLGDGAVTKLLHGADYDLRVLDRDIGARVRPLRDTQVAAQLLGDKQTGLGALLEREFGITLDKRHQRADWSVRPLPDDVKAYAVNDTAHLEGLAARLGERLAAVGRESWWTEECEALEGIRWQAPVTDPLAFERIKGAGRLRGEPRDRLAALHAWRERQAAAADVPPFKVLRGEVLLELAANPPADLAALADLKGVGHGTVRRWGRELLTTLTSPAPAAPRGDRPRFVRDRQRDSRVEAARRVRDEVATALALDPGVLAPRAGLESCAERPPRDVAELVSCLGRRWRAGALAAALLPLAAAWLEEERSGSAVTA